MSESKFGSDQSHPIWSKEKARNWIKYVLIIDTSDDSDEHGNMIFFLAMCYCLQVHAWKQ